MCVNTSKPSRNPAGTVEHTRATVGNKVGTGEKGSLGNSSTKQKAPENRPNSEGEIFDNRNYDNFEDCLELFKFFQNPKYRALISVGINAGTQRTVASLLDMGAGPNLI